MRIATFGPTSGWVGRRITRDGEVFVTQGHGEIPPLVIMENDRLGISSG
jgi:hypothetical protein